jgi:hypothetical protein
MDKATLVASDFAIGDKVVQALDEAKLPPTVALWVHLPEYGDWRFALASPDLDAAQPAAAYGLVRKALKAANIPPEAYSNAVDFPLVRSIYQGFAPDLWKN